MTLDYNYCMNIRHEPAIAACQRFLFALAEMFSALEPAKLQLLVNIVVKVAGVNYLKLPCALARGKCAHKPAASTTTGTRNVHAEIAECGT